MGCALISRRHQGNLKETTVKLFFLFHLGKGMLISIPNNTFPLTVEFDACQVLPCGVYVPTPDPSIHFSLL
jgi:hypothetical protein